MSDVQIISVTPDEQDQRLDRWFKRHFPQLGQGQLQKLLRTGQIRLDGKRSAGGARLAAGQQIRVPPLPRDRPSRVQDTAPVAPADAAELKSRILYRDASILVLNKPAGLAVQGGSKQHRHLDGMLQALAESEEERPRLVHRLDKDTSGVMVLGLTRRAAAALTKAFRDRAVEKTYWALVIGVPRPAGGEISKPIGKIDGDQGGRMAVAADGQPAVTRFATIDTAAPRASWLALRPVTGRMHQLRVHMASIGAPIVGDGKYGGTEAYLGGVISRKLHLHAQSLSLPHPEGGHITFSADLPEHMRKTWKTFGFNPADADDAFAEE